MEGKEWVWNHGTLVESELMDIGKKESTLEFGKNKR